MKFLVSCIPGVVWWFAIAQNVRWKNRRRWFSTLKVYALTGQRGTLDRNNETFYFRNGCRCRERPVPKNEERKHERNTKEFGKTVEKKKTVDFFRIDLRRVLPEQKTTIGTPGRNWVENLRNPS